MSRLVGKTALVTGASSGIGRAIAEEFAREGADLVIAAREAAPLAQLAAEWSVCHGVQVTALACDLAERGAAQALFDSVKEAGLEVDYLVNNAGVGVYGRFSEVLLERELAMMELNIVTPTVLCKRFLPGLMRRRGRIMNVASVAAFQPGPYMATYYATKAYLLSLSEALAEELSGSGVSVTTFCPGPTQSPFLERAGMGGSGLVQGKSLANADEVGIAGYKAMHEGKRLYVPGFCNRLLVNAIRLLPRRAVTRAVLKMSAPA
ncbi:short-chain dehydrogenase [Arenimonas soli]|uniref:Short-chain dehydrogenase n=1 Tax=Arenimonas soli TaxID=2269504 RepID=A0ABQ1HL57_9GAMM|nr:SDR family oxidoreductase [Arenimonas soli]GGA81889.1 short-chain dehydrogenase [Arenimonas soli]